MSELLRFKLVYNQKERALVLFKYDTGFRFKKIAAFNCSRSLLKSYSKIYFDFNPQSAAPLNTFRQQRH